MRISNNLFLTTEYTERRKYRERETRENYAKEREKFFTL
jgi:hypothetical protein